MCLRKRERWRQNTVKNVRKTRWRSYGKIEKRVYTELKKGSGKELWMNIMVYLGFTGTTLKTYHLYEQE